MTRIINLTSSLAPAIADILNHEGYTAVWFHSTGHGHVLEVLTDAPRFAIEAACDAMGQVSL